MPLSEYEQRVLEELEQQLRSDDPKLADTISGRAGRKPLQIGLGIVGLLGGLAALVGGLAGGHLWLSAVGFLLMFAGVLVAMSRPKGQPDGDASNVHPIRGGGGGKTAPRDSGFMDKLEERWDRRRREP
ncbi:DUF3040 domain-containing protein [Pseudactinotalea sp. Z1739]|uniref:DUF3040 domain-containing protein n=1 Tax=Pseudactinotalea sp. Z1739 TaxID=3413028 RepID=UPI003C7A70E9